MMLLPECCVTDAAVPVSFLTGTSGPIAVPRFAAVPDTTDCSAR